MAGNHHGHDGQPGLEVAEHNYYYAAPQALTPDDPRDPKYDDSYYTPHALPAGHAGDPKVNYAYGIQPSHQAPEYSPLGHELPGGDDGPPAAQRSRKWWIIGAVVLLLVIIGAVLGGLAGTGVIGGSGASSASSDPSTSTAGPGTSSSTTTASTTTEASATSTPTALSTPLLVRQGSPLAVAGWKKPDGDTEIFLFHQNDDYGIYYSRFYDGSASLTLNNTYWTNPVALSTYAGRDSRLAATLLLFGGLYQPQVQMYYSGAESRVYGVVVNTRRDPSISEDSLNNRRLVAQPGGATSTYWPWLTYQNARGELMEVRNLLGDAYSPQSSWDVRSLGLRTEPGSRVALVPMSTVFTKLAVGGGFGIVYRNSDGVLALAVPRLDEDEVSDSYARSWPSHDAFPSIEVELDAPIAAFSVARPRDSSGRVDTYVLYRDGTDIRMIYTAGGRSWEQAAPASLRDVDPDTDVACLTLASTSLGSNEKAQDIPPAGENAKCYFQRGGVVQEVVLDGTDWTEAQPVPIP